MNDDLYAIRRVLAAGVESFRHLVERYQRPLLTLIRNLTPPDTDHEGVGQEEFLAAFRSLASFDPKRSAFSTWLLSAVIFCHPWLMFRFLLTWDGGSQINSGTKFGQFCMVSAEFHRIVMDSDEEELCG